MKYTRNVRSYIVGGALLLLSLVRIPLSKALMRPADEGTSIAVGAPDTSAVPRMKAPGMYKQSLAGQTKSSVRTTPELEGGSCSSCDCGSCSSCSSCDCSCSSCCNS